MGEPYQLQATEGNRTLRLAWDNRSAPKDNVTLGCLILFWLVWVPATVFGTAILLNEADICLAVWCLAAWFGVCIIPYTWLGRRWSEWIEVSPTTITHGCQRLLAPKPRTYPLRPGVEPGFGWFEDEGTVTLGLAWRSPSGVRHRVLLGYWLAPRIKEQLFLAVSAFVGAHKIPLELKRYGDAPITADPE
ncbi:MAG: hypothetical protein L0Z62_40630 [Gemmataceae bacterium]|nr:hypothetical protein [Gemmataceae bacterium]